MNTSSLIRISRRTTLQWLAGATAASGLAYYAVSRTSPRAEETSVAGRPTGKGYGTDPDLQNPSVPWARTMTAHQLQMTAFLADLLLPGTADAPAPSALGIHDFVDEWVSAPYPEQQADRSIIFEGLKWIDIEASRLWRRGFLEVDDSHRQLLIGAMIPRSAADVSAQNTFFRRFRYVVVGAYYTTPEGFKDIGYIGNVPLASFPPVTDKEGAILDAELRKLGI